MNHMEHMPQYSLSVGWGITLSVNMKIFSRYERKLLNIMYVIISCTFFIENKDYRYNISQESKRKKKG